MGLQTSSDGVVMKTKGVVIIAVCLIALPFVASGIDIAVDHLGIPRFLAMTPAELIGYLGTCGAIVWAISAFLLQRSLDRDLEIRKLNRERPVLAGWAEEIEGSWRIRIENWSRFPAVYLACDDMLIRSKLNFGEVAILCFLGPDPPDEVFEECDCSIEGIQLNKDSQLPSFTLFAYSNSGDLWWNECNVSKYGELDIDVSLVEPLDVMRPRKGEDALKKMTMWKD